MAPNFGAIVIGIGGGVALLARTTVGNRTSIAGDVLIVIGPLLGVVFGAFALVIALFSDSYLRLLNEVEDGVAAFLRPFLADDWSPGRRRALCGRLSRCSRLAALKGRGWFLSRPLLPLRPRLVGCRRSRPHRASSWRDARARGPRAGP